MTNENDKDVEQYEGYDIIDTGIIITKTGDGLSETMRVAPVSIEPNAKAQIVVGLRKTKDRYDFIRDKQSGKILGVKWIQVFEATGAVFTKNQAAKSELDKMAEKIEKAKADAAGQLTMVLGGADDAPSRGKHPDLADQVDKALGD